MKRKNKAIVTFLIHVLGLLSGYFWYSAKKTIETQEVNLVQEVNNLQVGELAQEGESENISENKTDSVISNQDEQKPVVEDEPLIDFFSENGTFEETGEMSSSKMKCWWLNSVAYFYLEDSVGRTIQGELPKDEKWQIDYKNYSANETDDGFHPQNIFRLITKSVWKNFTQECYFKINRYILSTDSHRAASNGLLLFNRYQDGDNLYYTGIRVDGTVVVKKKFKGAYFTMAQATLYSGKYDRKSNPNLLPIDTWIGLRSEVRDNPNGTVSIKVYRDKDWSGDWQLVLTATDDGKKYGGAAIKSEGYAGIRTDFMDVEFDDYKIEELK